MSTAFAEKAAGEAVEAMRRGLTKWSGFLDNRFAGMRLEDLQGEILSLSKDQHGCRYLQKKLEEEVPEHRDMIFRETYGHFPELMTGEFLKACRSDKAEGSLMTISIGSFS